MKSLVYTFCANIFHFLKFAENINYTFRNFFFAKILSSDFSSKFIPTAWELILNLKI